MVQTVRARSANPLHKPHRRTLRLPVCPLASPSISLFIYLSVHPPSFHLSVHPVACLSIHLSTCLPIHLSCPLICLSACLSSFIHPFICPSVCSSVYSPVSPPVCLPVYLSIYLSCPPMSVCPPLFIHQPIHLSICLSIHLSAYLYVHPSGCPPICPLIFLLGVYGAIDLVLKDHFPDLGRNKKCLSTPHLKGGSKWGRL